MNLSSQILRLGKIFMVQKHPGDTIAMRFVTAMRYPHFNGELQKYLMNIRCRTEWNIRFRTYWVYPRRTYYAMILQFLTRMRVLSV